MINWYLTHNLRFEFAQGTSHLTQLGVIGTTLFFQSRIQLQL